MFELNILDVFSHALYIVIVTVSLLALPALITGLVIAVIQAATQVNDITLSFLPKLVVVLLTIMLLGPWLFHLLNNYTQSLFEQILLLNS